jgi:hypothetical protein
MHKTKTPFFARFLESQQLKEASGALTFYTLKYPSDSDEGGVTLKYPSDSETAVTLKFPSDSDEGGAVTLKYPSDSDEG